MTEHNIFDEAKEDFERQRLEALWKQYGSWVLTAALVIVVSTALTTAYRSWKLSYDQQMTDGLVTAIGQEADKGKIVDRLQKYADVNAGEAHTVFALLQAGSAAAEKGDKDKAINLFDQAAAVQKADPAFRQLGDLLSVEAQLDTGDVAKLNDRLQVLAQDNAPWHYSALQDQAYLALRAEDKAKAKQIFTDLSQDARAPHAMSARAADILRTLN